MAKEIKQRDSNTEEQILNAAREIFLAKGYAASRTVEIARKAGVNHAMLHYYFETKKKLFDKVFGHKIDLFLNSFSGLFENDLPFIYKIRRAIENHFDYLVSNPKLCSFLLNEVMTNSESKELFKVTLIREVKNLLEQLDKEIDAEVSKGTIKDISAAELIFNIGSLNMMSVIAWQFILKDIDGTTESGYADYLQQRREGVVQIILKSIS